MRYEAILRITSVLALAACAPGIVNAQADPDSVRHRNDCRLAAQTLATGHPAPREDWALEMIQKCAEGGRILAERFREERGSSDIDYLDALTRPTIRLRDGTIFATAYEIAEDRAASTPARVFAIRTLMWSMFPGGSITYEDLTDRVQGRARSCFGEGPSTHTQITQGAALPPDYAARAKSLGAQIAGNPAEAHEVRRAAVCLSMLQPWRGLPQ